MNADRLGRLGALSGTGAVVLGAIGIALVERAKPALPAGTTSFDYFPTAERALAILSHDPAQVRLGALLAGPYASMLQIVFAGRVFGALRDRAGRPGALAATALGGGLVSATALAVGYSAIWVAAARADRPGGLSPEEAVTVYDVYQVFAANVLTVGLATFVGATGIGALRTRFLPPWFGWASLVITGGLLTPLHWVFEGLAFIWTAAVSVLLFRRGGRAEQAER